MSGVTRSNGSFLIKKEKKEWTKARWHSFVVSILRSGTRRYPPKYECLNEAKTVKKINVKSGRIAQHYKCNSCKNEFTATDVQVDHIEPIVGRKGFTTWDSFIENMFCGKENLQVLCLACHQIKTQLERKGKND